MIRSYFLTLSVLYVLAAPGAAAAAPQKASHKPITEITLERVGGGPQWSGHGWPQDTIVLHPIANTGSNGPDEFAGLAQWLKKSGFFSRQEGRAARLFPLDVGYLVITVSRGSERKQVFSYNGERDAELWQTEMVIRGVAATRRLEADRAAWVKKHEAL